MSGVKIAAAVVLAQYKGNERIGEVQKRIYPASPIVTKLA
jgi:hypothetical protein